MLADKVTRCALISTPVPQGKIPFPRYSELTSVTRQTADTFDAAATFFDLLREWGELEAEVLQKIKFAKWNAARILKAIREGRDPNETNPKQPEKEETEQDPAAALQLDSNDPDVQDITTGVPPQPASVQDIPDAGEPLGTAGSSRQPPSVPEDYFPSGLQLSPGPPPSVPDGMPPSVPTTLPGAPPEDPVSASSQIPLQPSPQIPTKLPSQFSPPVDTAPPPPTFDVPPPVAPVVPAAAPPPPQPTAPVPPPAQSIPPPAAPPPATNVHHKDLNQAQKHAKWAISALNFEDVPTAVQELRNALAALGTQ